MKSVLLSQIQGMSDSKEEQPVPRIGQVNRPIMNPRAATTSHAYHINYPATNSGSSRPYRLHKRPSKFSDGMEESMEDKRSRVMYPPQEESISPPAIEGNVVNPVQFAQQYFYGPDGKRKDLNNLDNFSGLFSEDSYIDPEIFMDLAQQVNEPYRKVMTTLAVQSIMTRCQQQRQRKESPRMVEPARPVPHASSAVSCDGQTFYLFEPVYVHDLEILKCTHPLETERKVSLFSVVDRVALEPVTDLKSLARQAVSEFMSKLFEIDEIVLMTGSKQTTMGYVYVGSEVVRALLAVIGMGYSVRMTPATKAELAAHLDTYLKRFCDNHRTNYNNTYASSLPPNETRKASHCALAAYLDHLERQNESGTDQDRVQLFDGTHETPTYSETDVKIEQNGHDYE